MSAETDRTTGRSGRRSSFPLMNTQAATPLLPRSRLLLAIATYLHNENLQHSLTALLEETSLRWSPDEEDVKEGLLEVFMAAKERENDFSDASMSAQAENSERIMSRLSASGDLVVERVCVESRPHRLNNILAVAWQPFTSDTTDQQQYQQQEEQCQQEKVTVATGGVDKSVMLHRVEWKRREEERESIENETEVINTLYFAAPILCLEFAAMHPHLLAVGCMNGQSAVCDVRQVPLTPTLQQHAVFSLHQDHHKYVVAVRFSPQSDYLSTASTDGTLVIRKRPTANSEENNSEWTMYHRVEYRTSLEAIAWISDTVVLAAPREDNYLHAIDIERKTEIAKYNMNASGDDHVSFSAMHLSCSPDRSLLAIATDQHRLIVMMSGSAIQIRNCYSLQNNGFSTPRLAWSKSGRYLYISQQNATVFVYDVSEGKHVRTLTGHEVNVRDLASHPQLDALATVSFDKTLRLWK